MIDENRLFLLTCIFLSTYGLATSLLTVLFSLYSLHFYLLPLFVHAYQQQNTTNTCECKYCITEDKKLLKLSPAPEDSLKSKTLQRNSKINSNKATLYAALWMWGQSQPCFAGTGNDHIQEFCSQTTRHGIKPTNQDQPQSRHAGLK